MGLRLYLICIGLIGVVTTHTSILNAQVYFSKYVGNVPSESRGHYFELFNEHPHTIDLSGYLVVSRNYVLRIPDNTFINPLQKIRIGNPFQESSDLYFEDIRSFKYRYVEGLAAGDFLILLDNTSASRQLVDAFLFSREREVDYLPYKEELSLRDMQDLVLSVPSEEAAVWKFLRAEDEPDPALAYLRIGGVWKISSRTKNMLPALDFSDLSATFDLGSVNLAWTTESEQDCYNYFVLRSEDGNNYQQIGIVPAKENSNRNTYSFVDNHIRPDKRYYYRIKNIDKFGFPLFSEYEEVRTGETDNRFDMQIIRIGQALNLRFASAAAQHIRIKIMDADFREIDLLFHGEVEANKDNLIEYLKNLNVGKYYVIAQTEEQRFYEEFIIRE